MLFSRCHTVVSVIKMAKAICSTNVITDYFDTLAESCRQRYAKNLERINVLDFYTIGHFSW